MFANKLCEMSVPPVPLAQTSQSDDVDDVVLYSTTHTKRRSSIIGKPPPSDLFSSLSAEPHITSTSPVRRIRQNENERVARPRSAVSYVEPDMSERRPLSVVFKPDEVSPSMVGRSKRRPVSTVSRSREDSPQMGSPIVFSSPSNSDPYTLFSRRRSIVSFCEPAELGVRPRSYSKSNGSVLTSPLQHVATNPNRLSNGHARALLYRSMSGNSSSSPEVSLSTENTSMVSSPSELRHSPYSLPISPQNLLDAFIGEPPLRESMEAMTVSSGNETEKRKLHILVAATGSVATIKIPLIISKLRSIYGSNAIIQLVLTTAAEHFLKGTKLPGDVKVWSDEDEWNSQIETSESELHVQLRRWADILLIAPLSANTLSKLANGICDNLITSVFRAWGSATPVVLAPAMNTHMYTNPMTKRHFALIQDMFPYVTILKPIEKVLVCGDIGMGGMREWTDVVENVIKKLGGPRTLEEEELQELREKRERRIKKLRDSGIDFPVVLDIPSDDDNDDEGNPGDEDEEEEDDDDCDGDDDDNSTAYNPPSSHVYPSRPGYFRSHSSQV